jgi:hypothetical protein
MATNRPIPPKRVTESFEPIFEPAGDVETWIRETFLDSGSPLFNVEHDHLNSAQLGILWTNVANSRNMRGIVGQAEMPLPQGGKWQKERAFYQLTEWFGGKPDFLITLDANYAAKAGDIEWCALVDHELYHCAQMLDKYGFPAFTKDGQPRFAIKGHDVEEFVGIVRRYGAGPAAGDTQALVMAAQQRPEIAEVDIAGMCGTCVSHR